MKNDSVEVIPSNTIHSFSVKVTEKIDSKYIDDFIRTNIDTHNIKIGQNSNFYYIFIESSLSYEIIVFDKTNKKNFILEPFLSLGYYDDLVSNNNIDIFLTNNYFTLFKDKKFLLFKNISDVSQEDIKLYLSQTYNMQIDNIIELDKQKLEDIKQNYFTSCYPKIKYKYTDVKKDNSFKIFQLFFLIISLSFGYFVYSKSDKLNEVTQPSYELISLENRYKNLKLEYNKHNKKVIGKTIDLFKYLKLNNIIVDKLEYTNSKIQTVFLHKNKKKLLDFITTYGDNIDIKSIEYQDKKDNYKMVAVIKV